MKVWMYLRLVIGLLFRKRLHFILLTTIHRFKVDFSVFCSICLKSGNTKPLVTKWPCCFKDIFYLYIYTYILTPSLWTGTKVIRRKHIIQPTGFGACSSTRCQWDGEDVPAPWERYQTPNLLFESKNHVSTNSYSITCAVEAFLLSIIPNSVIVWSLQ